MKWEIKKVIITIGIIIAIGLVSILVVKLVPGEILLCACVFLMIANAIFEIKDVIRKYKK